MINDNDDGYYDGSRYYHLRDDDYVWVEISESEMFWKWCAMARVQTADGRFIALGYCEKQNRAGPIDKASSDKAVERAMIHLRKDIEDYNHSVWLNRSRGCSGGCCG